MRFQLHSGANLIARDFGFCGQATSDPYAVVKIGASTFKSGVVKKTLNPVWKDHIEDFLIFSKRQLLTIACFDQDIGSGDDGLGKCAMQVGDIATKGRVSMELTMEGEEDAGTIDVSIKVMEVVPSKEVGGVKSTVFSRWWFPWIKQICTRAQTRVPHNGFCVRNSTNRPVYAVQSCPINTGDEDEADHISSHRGRGRGYLFIVPHDWMLVRHLPLDLAGCDGGHNVRA